VSKPIVQSHVPKPEVVQTHVSKLEVGRANVPKPKVVQSHVSKPEVGQTNVSKSEVTPSVTQASPQVKAPQVNSKSKTPPGSAQANDSQASKPKAVSQQKTPPTQAQISAMTQPVGPQAQSVAAHDNISPQQKAVQGNRDQPQSPVPQAADKAGHSQSPQTEVVDPPAPQPASKSWASLFAGKGGSESGTEAGSSKPMAVISPYSPGPLPTSQVRGAIGTETGDIDRSLGVFLRDYQLKHSSTALLPRGLTNRSNWCFVNAIMQALLACPPLYNLMRSLTIDPAMSVAATRTNTPMLDSVTKFMSEFSVLEPVTGTRAQKKDKSKRRNDIVTGVGLEPSFIFNMLLGLQEDTFKVVEGRQEDAEEFLTCLLNGLSDEMQELIKLTEEPETEGEDEEEEQEGEDWQEVGAKGKSCVTRRVAGTSQPVTPVQALALGMCRSCVKVEGKDSSATLQPFYTLQLDIQDRDIQSVTDALLANFASEKLDGFVCGKTKQEVDATRSQSLEELPPVLILHLKRFVYDAATGGVQKIMKPVEFCVDLEVSKSVLSAECRAATTSRHRQYKLFSVVYHNGREATKGHYVTDVFHTGYSTWLHCDDGIVQPTAEELVVNPGPSSTPYILFYRRGDTMVGMERREP
jgi:ubiquitin carboxyl-terminal hydrolase 10